MTLKNVVKVTKIYSLLSPLPKVFLCKFGQNPDIGSGGSVRIKLTLYSLNLVVTLKVGQGHQNLIKFCDCPNNIVHEVWSESII